MKLSENPFSLLKASSRDRKVRLIELSEEAELFGDHGTAVNARNVLSNPRTRLSAEIAWFPGLSPKRIRDLLGQIAHGESPAIEGLNPLCGANFAAEALTIHAGSAHELEEGVKKLSSCVELIEPEEVQLTINEDRLAAGIPEVADLALIEAAVADRIRYFERLVTGFLEELPSRVMVDVYEGLVSWSTEEGEDIGHRLVDVLVDSYELKAGEFLTDEAIRITELVDAAQAAADRKVAERQVRASVNEIVAALRTWDSVAQPIQLAYKGRGLDHEESRKLAASTRNLAVHLFNEHDYLEDAKLLSAALQELFSEVVAVSEQIRDDVDALENIAVQRAERQRNEVRNKAEFARDVTYETTFGVIFKDRFRISPEGFEYKGLLVPLDQITGVRWGAVRKTVNGAPSGTDYYFGFGTSRQGFEMRPDERQYGEIIQRAWRAVCFPILLRWIDLWAAGKSVDIAGVAVSDDGLVLERSSIFREDELKFFPWSDVRKSAHNGYLNFTGQSDSGFHRSFSYKDAWNVHVFDFAVSKVWEGKPGLSRIFES